MISDEQKQIISSTQFLKFIGIYANQFKANKGYGRWLVEYEQMDKDGIFKPEKLRSLYISILLNKFKYSFIVRDAVWHICVPAFDATAYYLSAIPETYDIRVLTGEIALDDDGEKLINMSKQEAVNICEAMNDDFGETLFEVYNSITNQKI